MSIEMNNEFNSAALTNMRAEMNERIDGLGKRLGELDENLSRWAGVTNQILTSLGDLNNRTANAFFNMGATLGEIRKDIGNIKSHMGI